MEGSERPAVWCLMGPTATGKTALATALCERFPFEIVSVDSSLVYRGMDVGTAKPESHTLSDYPHHLIDIREPWESYSAADFCRDTRRLLDEIIARGRCPLLVGGTMFYFRALELGLPEHPQADPQVRSDLEARAARDGWSALYEELQRLDPARAARIDAGDRQRVQRALEIVKLTGASAYSDPARRRGGIRDRYRICKLALAPADRAWLHRRVEQRLRAMLRGGLVEEVRNLMSCGKLSKELPALRMVGYRQVVQYLDGELGYNEMERRGIAATRQLAKRQLTWLRNQPGVVWFDCSAGRLLDTVTDYIRAKKAVFGQ